MNKQMMIVVGIILVVALIGFAAADYIKVCLTDGESIPLEGAVRYTCEHDLCQVCTTENYYPTLPSRCNDVVGCVYLDGSGGGSTDNEAPEITINNPIDESVQTSRSVLIDVQVNEYSKIERYYESRRKWLQLCSSCLTYSRKIRFKDGEQDLTIRATDRKGNSNEETVSFFVDSKKPRISRTFPRRGFADGNFEVQLSEENPKTLILNYGNSLTGFEEEIVDVEDACEYERRRYYCDAEVNLENYNGQEISYWFELTDIADNEIESRKVDVDVDTEDPEYELDYEIDGRYVYFDFTIEEDNFDEVNYIDRYDRRPRWKRLCSRLKEGKCSVKKSFRRGDYKLDIEVRDEAGNSVGETIWFEIDY